MAKALASDGNKEECIRQIGFYLELPFPGNTARDRCLFPPRSCGRKCASLWFAVEMTSSKAGNWRVKIDFAKVGVFRDFRKVLLIYRLLVKTG